MRAATWRHGVNEKRSPGRPLAEIREGEGGRLVDIQGGRALRARLSSLGLVPGAEVRVLRNLSHGPMLILVKGSRIALGRGVCRKIRLGSFLDEKLGEAKSS